MYIKVKKNKLFWHYIVKAGNGQTLSTSETYYSKSNAVRAAHKLAIPLRIEVK